MLQSYWVLVVMDQFTRRIVALGHTVAGADLNDVRWASRCRGLVQLPMAA